MSSSHLLKVVGAAVAGLILAGGLVGVYVLPSMTDHVHIIELRDDGFYPATSTISRNDTVQFISSRNLPHWPASDYHPTHSEYPEFDPQRPLQPTETWEFTFTEAGTWHYHDHLYSFFTGAIIVE